MISKEYPEIFSREKGLYEFSPQEVYTDLLLNNTVENKSLKTKYSKCLCICQARELIKHNSYAKFHVMSHNYLCFGLHAVAKYSHPYNEI